MLDPEELPGTRVDLAAALLGLRRAAGLSGRELAERAFMTQSTISRIESGRRIASVADVEAIVRACGAAEDTRARLLALARTASVDYRSGRERNRRGLHVKQAELRGFERSAAVVRHFLPAVPTGLMHTREYALATLEGFGVADEDARHRVVEGRLARQAMLDDENRVYRFLLTEQAVRARVAPAAVLAGQCRHMAELGGRPNIDVALLPFAGPMPVMPLNVFVVYDERFVTVEVFSGELLLHDPRDVGQHVELWERLRARAIDGTDAAGFLLGLAASYGAESG